MSDMARATTRERSDANNEQLDDRIHVEPNDQLEPESSQHSDVHYNNEATADLDGDRSTFKTLKRKFVSILEWTPAFKRPRINATPRAWANAGPRIAEVPRTCSSAVSQEDIEQSTSARRVTARFLLALEGAVAADQEYKRLLGRQNHYQGLYKVNLDLRAVKYGRVARLQTLGTPDEEEEEKIRELQFDESASLFLRRAKIHDPAQALKIKDLAFARLSQCAKTESVVDPRPDHSDVMLSEDLLETLQQAIDAQSFIDDHRQSMRAIRQTLLDVGQFIRDRESTDDTGELRKERASLSIQLEKAKKDQVIHKQCQLVREEAVLKIARAELAKRNGKAPGSVHSWQVFRGDNHRDIDENDLACARDRVPRLRDDFLEAIAEAKTLVARCEKRYDTLRSLYSRDLIDHLLEHPEEQEDQAIAFDRQFARDRVRATGDLRKAQDHVQHLRRLARDVGVFNLEDINSNFSSQPEDGFTDTHGSFQERAEKGRRDLNYNRVEKYCNEVAASGAFMDPFAPPPAPVFAEDLHWREPESALSDPLSMAGQDSRDKRLIKGWRKECEALREQFRRYSVLEGDEPQDRRTDSDLRVASRLVRAAKFLWYGLET